MKKTSYYIFFISVLFCLQNLYSQEKKSFLQQRFDGFITTINNDSTLKNLQLLKHNLARTGIDFNFSNLRYNSNNKITRISIKLKNPKSTATLNLDRQQEAIPAFTITETNGIVQIKLTNTAIESNQH